VKITKSAKQMVSVSFAFTINLAVALLALLSKRKKHSKSSRHCVVR